MTITLRRYVAKRTNATREDPTAAATVLGFVDAPNQLAAGEKAHARWGIDGENQLLVVVPVGRCRAEELRQAADAELDDRHGPGFGKRVEVVCSCACVNYFHPRKPHRVCLWCKKTLKRVKDHLYRIVDVATEDRAAELEQSNDLGGSD